MNARHTLKKNIKDPELRAKLTPDYKLGCKRVVMNDYFFDAIQQPNAHLVTEGIKEIVADGIITTDGQHHPLDVIVFATGFNPKAFMRPMEFTGKNGLSIDKAWEKKVQSYRSVSLPNFPNFFLMLGPNSPIGNNSIILTSELQADYCLKLIEQWQQQKLDTIEPKLSAMQSWNAILKERMGHTVWTSGCDSWYLDADGDSQAWPDRWQKYVASMEHPDFNDYVANNKIQEDAAVEPNASAQTI